MSVTSAEQVMSGQVIALENDGEPFDMSLPLGEQTVGWDLLTVKEVRHYPATSTLDIFFDGGYRHRTSVGQEVFVILTDPYS